MATIAPGTILDSDTVVALCRTRDIGTAASVADPAQPPAILLGTDPATWPRLAGEGQQAVADLVASVTPMVYVLTRNESNREDLRGEMFVHLMRVAHTYDPTRTNAVRWPTYAWETLQHLRWRGVDNAGVPRQRIAQPLRMISLDGTEPISRDPRPDDLVVGQAGIEATRDAVNALPTRLREPLLLAMAGKTFHEIGDELGISSTTAHRRTAVARRVLQRELDIGGQDHGLHRRDHGTRRSPNQGATDVQQGAGSLEERDASPTTIRPTAAGPRRHPPRRQHADLPCDNPRHLGDRATAAPAVRRSLRVAGAHRSSHRSMNRVRSADAGGRVGRRRRRSCRLAR